MGSVNIADLKNRLSQYLIQVRQGEELLVRDRDVPIAKIVPLSAAAADLEELSLAAAGLLRLTASRLPTSFWTMPAPRVSVRRAADAVRVEREGR